MKLHLPASLRSAVFSCFATVCALSTSLATGTLFVYAAYGTSAYAAYNASTATFEGTDNGAINPTAATYSGVETLIFNMGTSGTGNHLSNASWTYAGNIQIGAAGATGTGLCLNNGNRNQTDVFTGKVTGTGMLSKTGAGTNLTIAFEGDVTEFTGAIRLGSTAAFTLRFGGGSAAPANQSAVHGVSGTGDITFTGTDKDTLTYNYSTGSPVYITNRIITNAGATSKVALNGRAHYVLTQDAAISDLTLSANNTLHIGTTGHSSATVLGALTMGAGAAVHVDNGSLEVLNATSLAGTYAIGTEGVLHLSRTAALDGSLTVAQGGALSIGALSGFSDVGGGLQTPAEGENGFASMNGKLSILTGSADKLQALEGTKVLHEGKNLELAGDGTVTLAEVDYSAYYLRSGEKTLSSLVAESDNKLTRIEMGTGVKLAVDSGAVQGSYSVGSERSVALSELGASTIVGDIRIDNLSATETIFVASGATLSIGSTAEGFSRDINLSSDSHLVFEADAPTAMSVGSIINTADRKDDFRRSVRVGEGVSLQASSIVNSWGMESLTVDGELNISGALSFATGGSRWGNSPANNLIAGEGHITAGSLNISNASEYNTISVHELTITGATSISRSTTISGGTTELLGTTTVSGALNLTGGHLILGDELSDTATLSGDINLSSGEMTLNGTASLGSNLHQTGGTLTVNGDLVQTSTLTASGTLALNGTLKADSAALDTIGDVTYSDGVNGYRQGTFVLVNKGEGALSLQRGTNGVVLLDGEDATSFLSSDASGNILLADSVGSVYYVFEGEAVYGGAASTVDTERTTGFNLYGGHLSLLAEREDGHHLNLTADAEVTLGAGVSLSAASVTGAEHLTLSGAGNYVVNTLAELAAVTRSELWTGTTLINDRISNPNDETELSRSGNLSFLQQATAERGGAICNQGTFTFSENGNTTFSGNATSTRGGAIYNDSGSTFTLRGNGDVTFSENTTGAYGGAIHNAGIFSLSENGNVNFSRNIASTGGAIYNVGTFTLRGNRDVTFSGNTISVNLEYYGGAIFNYGNFTLCGNGKVSFIGNSASSSYGCGAAVANEGGNAVFALNGNGDVCFIGNHATMSGGAIENAGAFSLCENENVSFSENTAGTYGGAISSAGTFTLRENSDVTFSANVSSWIGGAIYNNSGNYTLESNGAVSFRENTASSNGGAIYSSGTFMLNGNESVTFSANVSSRHGGAIYNHGTFTLRENSDVAFSENAASYYGGAIYNSGTYTLESNGAVSFRANTTSSDGGGIYNDSSAGFTLNGNASVTFSENQAFSGGGIYNASSAGFTLNGNESVCFNKNTASHHGGAIYSDGTFTLSGNESVNFSENTAIYQDGGAIYYQDGGAIYCVGTFTLSENSDVNFSGNTARYGGAICNSSDNYYTFEANGTVSFSGNQAVIGGAISNYGTFTFSENGNSTFSGNSASTSGGGAIYNYVSFSLSGNENVSFSENTTTSYGGAIYNIGTFSLRENSDVTFSANVSSRYGGAIYNYGTFSLRENSDVTFSENVSLQYGGAIYNSGTYTLESNGAVSFRANTTSSSGGGIYNYSSAGFTLNGNESVNFSENTASSNGGAIYNSGTYTLESNGTVSFSNNQASSGGGIYNASSAGFTLNGNESVNFSENTASSYGGAIYNSGIFTLEGNGDVVFEKNAVVKNGVYRLRSIYSDGGTLNLSATVGKSILFKDSIYASGTVNLNLNGTGDIIFSGATTEADLHEVKGGVDGTAKEILNSLTSVLSTEARIYGGRLIVEDEAILKVNGLSVAEGASMVVKDATLALMNGNATITTADGAEKAVMVGASLGTSSLVGTDAERRGTVEGARIELAEGVEFSLQHLVLGATSRITDDPASLQLDDVTAELVMGVNASLTGSDMLLAGTTLEQSGNTGVPLTLSADASVLMLEATTFDSVTLTGATLVLELTGMEVEMFDSAEWIGISFTSGMAYATFDKSLAVTLSVDGVTYVSGYTMESDDSPTTMYFRGVATPEPATTTLSLLALAALAARRKRKQGI